MEFSSRLQIAKVRGDGTNRRLGIEAVLRIVIEVRLSHVCVTGSFAPGNLIFRFKYQFQRASTGFDKVVEETI